MNKYGMLAFLLSVSIPLGAQAQTKVVTTYVDGQIVDQYVENEYGDEYDEVYEDEEIIYEEGFDEIERREVYIVETSPEVVHVYYERPAVNISFQVIPFFRLRYYYPTANIYFSGWFPPVYHQRYHNCSYYQPIRHGNPHHVYHSRLPQHVRHVPKGYKPHHAYGKNVKHAPRGYSSPKRGYNGHNRGKSKAYGNYNKKGWKGNKQHAYNPGNRRSNKYSAANRGSNRSGYKSHNNSRRSQPRMSPGNRSRGNTNKMRHNSGGRSSKMYAQGGRRGGGSRRGRR